MPNRFLRLPEVKLRVGLSRSSLYLRMAQGTFVKPIRLGPNSVAWREEDIDRWMTERITAGAAESTDALPESSAKAHEAPPAPEHRAEAAAGPVAPVGKHGFAARQTGTPALMSTRDGRR